MTRNQNLRALLSGAIVLTVLVGAPRMSGAQASSPVPDPARERLRGRIEERIRAEAGLSDDERTTMTGNLEVCLRSGVSDAGLEALFPGTGRGRRVSTATMLRLQTIVRSLAQEGLPVEPVLSKVQEASMKGVPDVGLPPVAARAERNVREARRIVTEARAQGMRPAADAGRERQMTRELAQQMWRGTTPAEFEALCAGARGRARGTCSLEDLVATAETATRLRESGVEPARATRVAGEALRRGYGAEEMRRLQYMMVYRHRQGRGVKNLVDDFEHCLGQGMDSARMYQYMMQHGWLGPGDTQGPGGSRPLDDPGRGRGGPGGAGAGGGDLRSGNGGPGTGSGVGGGGAGQSPSSGGPVNGG